MEKIDISVSGQLTEITTVDHLLLKEAITRSGNFATILMHPYYGNTHQDQESAALLSNLLSSADDNLPIFIFEDNPMMRNYSQIKRNSENRVVCIVPTVAGSPHPVVGWDKLMNIFKEIGVEDFVMAGKYLTYQEDGDGLADYQLILRKKLEGQGLKLDRTLAACIGIAAGILVENDFNIHLSELSSPLKLSDFE
jgi:hypothetical protein